MSYGVFEDIPVVKIGDAVIRIDQMGCRRSSQVRSPDEAVRAVDGKLRLKCTASIGVIVVGGSIVDEENGQCLATGTQVGNRAGDAGERESSCIRRADLAVRKIQQRLRG